MFHLSELLTSKIYGLLTKCEVKMAGYWPSSFYEFSMDQDRVLRKKAERGQHQAILTNKGFTVWLLGKFFSRTQRVVPSGQDSSILPAQVANYSAGFDSSRPLMKLVA